MDERPDEQSDAIERWQRWLREEGARYAARATDEETKARIEKLIEEWCDLLSRGWLQSIESVLPNFPKACEKLLNPPPPRGIDRLPIEGQPIADQWRDLCLWLTMTAHQIMGETDSPQLKRDIRAQLRALTHGTQRPDTFDALRSRVTKFRKKAAGWSNARLETILSK
jgi:hypothetical protein